MTRALFLLFLTVFSLYLVLLIRSFAFMSKGELKRQARKGNKLAAKVYSVRLYGSELWILLWAILGLSVTAIILISAAFLSDWLVLAKGAFLSVLLGFLLPRASWPKPSLQLAAMAAPVLKPAIRFMHPLWRKIIKLNFGFLVPEQPKQIHSKEELLEMLARSRDLTDEVSEDELEIAGHALEFGDKKILDYMTPISMVRLVDKHDIIGVKLLSELHKSGFSRFPVYEQNAQNIIGTLYYKDIAMQADGRTAEQLMRPDVIYVNEHQSLEHALNAFLRTHHHLFMVVNNFEEKVGVISIEDVLEQIIGKKIIDEFDQYSDLRAVAALRAKEIKKAHQSVEPAKPPAAKEESKETKSE